MLTLDLRKDSVLIVLLQKILRTARKINPHDESLNAILASFESIAEHPEEVDYYDLHNKIEHLAVIVKSYQKTDPTNEALTSLPQAIFSLVSGLDGLKNRNYLDKKYFSTAELDILAGLFCKKAGV